MNVQSIIHRPEVVVPDATIENVTPAQLIDAVNIRLSKFTAQPGRKIGVRSITGNQLVPNSYLPQGDNYAVGTCTDFVNGRIFFANWNSEGEHAIYAIYTDTFTNQEEIKPVIRWSGLDWNRSDYVSMAYDRGIVIWSCPNTEPRFINVERGINTEFAIDNQSPNAENIYPTPYFGYFFDQLRMPPQDPPIFLIPPAPNGLLDPVWLNAEKPIPEITQDAYQFAYNYEYLDNTESRMSPPSIACWGILKDIPAYSLVVIQQLFLTEADNQFIANNSSNQRVIIAIRWYYRQGNTGEWVYFKRSVTDTFNFFPVGYYDTFGVDVPPFDELTSIGPISPAAMLLVDGIARRVVDNVFASNRVIHAGLTSGYDLELPGADLATVVENSHVVRNLRWFAPIERKKQFALVFYDQRDRIIGTKIVGSLNIAPTPQQYARLDYALTNNPGIWNQGLNGWNQVWFNGSGQSLIDIDLQGAPAVKITPQSVPAQDQSQFLSVVSKVGVAEKNQFEVSSFIRTQVRVLWVYKDANGVNVYGSNDLNQVNDFALFAGNLVFYGIGFEFCSGEPINFSNEQNYHIKIRSIGDILGLAFTMPAINTQFFFDKEFEITEQDGPILLSKQNYSQNGYSIPDLIAGGFISGLVGNREANSNLNNLGFTFDTFFRFSQSIADIVLYSKGQTTDTQWKIIPQISWTASDFITGGDLFYYGDAYGIQQKTTLAGPTSRSWIFKNNIGINRVTNYPSGLNSTSLDFISCIGWFISMNQNGTQLESYTSDIGNVVIMNENPEEVKQLRTYAHGEQFLEGTKVNSWFAFNPENRRIVSGYIGDIVKVITQSLTSNMGENLYIHCRKGVEMVFLGKVQQTGTDGTGVLSLSTNIFGTTNTHRLPYGPKYAKQVTQTTRGVSFYFDPDSRVLVQVSSNGQDAISEQRKFQKDTFRISPDAAIGFDPFNMEILLTGSGSGLAYNFEEDKYQGRRMFRSNELFAFVSSEDRPKTMYGFYNGEVYRFLNEPLSTVSINGAGINQNLKFIANNEINKHKVFSFVRLLSEYNNSADVIDWRVTIDGFNIGNAAISEILSNEFVKRHYFYQATIKTNMDVDKFDGPLMAGPFIEITLSAGDKTLNLIFAEIGYTLPPSQ